MVTQTVKVMDYNTIKWEDYLELNTNSPTGLIYKRDRRNGRSSTFVKGSIAGKESSHNNGWYVNNKGDYYKVHRIIWYLANGSIDLFSEVLHKDGNSFNNNLNNLLLKEMHE